MERLWFVALDTVRLRNAISDAHASAVEPATVDAAHDAGVQLLDACIVGTGMRCIVRARDRDQIRTFSRRFVARVAPLVAQSAARWQPAARACRVPESSAGSWRAFLTRCRQAFRKSATMAVEISAPTRPSTARSRGTPRTRARKGASLVRRIQTAVDIALGGDESAARLRRYVADHDAPPNDAAAFARMCEVIFSQGIGFAVVARKREALERAFAGFAPAAVAAFSESDVRRALGEPIIRNITKIRACVANAKRWCAAPQGSYLAFLASQASDDDPMSGWPARTALVQGDFQRLNDIGARQTL
ncbi:MAG: DNA-3-methyladenine glycosylase I, partial [Candidatus Eremiobacteraeota bacterium]|nr:DNA-3-methyladenine glycosylase I [Candidatus Eremiobacteraeota bacterium]